MCGLAAVFDPGRRFDAALLSAIEKDLWHRGPDSGGTMSEAGFGLAFRRLAIIDPRAISDQPMTDAQGRCTIIFNGEIYNYREARRDLQQAGVELRTTSDTEVILQGYLRWGDAVFERLEGMFALCIIDRLRRIGLVARDPLGIKPLYMLRSGRLTAFASEVRPFRHLKPLEVCETSLAELVTFGWAAGSLSNYRNVTRVPRGTVVKVELDAGAIRERCFFDAFETLTPAHSRVGDLAEDVRGALEKSVQAHLLSDVGYSVQLSGGVDSSLIAAMAAKATEGRLHAFSVGLSGHRYDEAPYQKLVASQYGIEHEIYDVSSQDYADALPRAIQHMEGPTPHGGCVMLMLLCDRIRHKYKVVLTGEGADEMFGGYQRYAVWRKTMWQERLARWLPRASLPNIWPFSGARRLAGLDAAAYAAVYHDFRSIQAMFPGLVPRPGAREAASRRFAEFRDRLFAVDQFAYLESLLVRQDRMSMAASVEARVPFVHVPLLKLVNGLPHSVRVPGGNTKPLLKQIAREYLPLEVVDRRKIGLWLPYHEWFADAHGAGRYLDSLSGADSRLATYAGPGKLRQFVDRFRAGPRTRHDGLVLQRLVETELWLRSVSFEALPAQAAA